MKKFEVKLTGNGNEPKVSIIISPDGETVYENWAATETVPVPVPVPSTS